MKGWILAMFLVGLIDPGKIGKINTLKSEARAAYQAGDFKTAITKYKYLVDSLGVTEDEVTMNLANSYFQAADTAHAEEAFNQLVQSNDKRIRSIANQQLGVINTKKDKLEEALNFFKQALKAAPENDDARYNYELVKKKLEKQKQQQQNQDQKDQNNKDKDQKDQNKDQKNKDDQQKKDQDKQQNKDQKNKDQQSKDQQKKEQEKKEQEKKEQEKKEQQKQDQQKQDQEKNSDEQKKDEKNLPPSVSKKLQDMQMSEEKARMLLDAMKNQEIQFWQQNKRKATKPKERTKPDW